MKIQKEKQKEQIQKVLKPVRYVKEGNQQVLKEAVIQIQEKDIDVWVIEEKGERHVFKNEVDAKLFAGVKE